MGRRCAGRNSLMTMTYQYQVSFLTAVKRAFSQYCSFHGRASRSEYWWFFLFNFLVGAVIVAVFGGSDYVELVKTSLSDPVKAGSIELSGSYTTISYIWSLITLLPGLGLFWRRMHDAGHSGWWWLWSLLPVIGWIVLLVALCKNSVPAENKYGPVPNVTTVPDR